MNVFKDFVLSKLTLTDRLLEEVSDYDIYCELTNIEFELGQSEISPIRPDDNVPSFSLFIPTKKSNLREEEVWWRDFRDGSGNVFKFAKLFARLHFDLRLQTQYEVITFIDDQLELGLLNKTGKKRYIKKRYIDYESAKEAKEILFKSRPYTERDLLWWLHYGVDEELLIEHDVRSVRFLLGEDFMIYKKISIYDLAFAFIVYDKLKLYRPEASPTEKWRNTCPAEYLQGWQQLKGCDTLIITKSYKDVLVFKSFMNVDVVAPQSESGGLSDYHIEYIKENYKNVFIVFDYDEAGKIGANKLADLYNYTIRWVSTLISPGMTKPKDKDISDYMFNNGLTAGEAHLKTMFPELDSSYFKVDRVNYLTQLLKTLEQL